ncbi:Uncharacterised protein [uncultured archaeon]|nr:Uncharacterised protein [uncultured archaeon]
MNTKNQILFSKVFTYTLLEVGIVFCSVVLALKAVSSNSLFQNPLVVIILLIIFIAFKIFISEGKVFENIAK